MCTQWTVRARIDFGTDCHHAVLWLSGSAVPSLLGLLGSRCDSLVCRGLLDVDITVSNLL